MILTQLFWRFVVVSLLAFGGGQAALPLVERLAVAEAGWVSPADFSAAVAFGYITPGPVLITATFIGYRTAGFLGALSATIGVFVAPWLLATLAAWQVQRWLTRPWLKGFGEWCRAGCSRAAWRHGTCTWCGAVRPTGSFSASQSAPPCSLYARKCIRRSS